MMSTDLAIPVALFLVRFEAALGRAFSECERTILRCIDNGVGDYEGIVDRMALHPRIVAESIATLIETGLANLTVEGRLGMTEPGRHALTEPTYVPEGLRGVPRHRVVLVDRVTGFVDVKTAGLKIKRANELSPEVPFLHPSGFDPTPGRAALRRVLEARARSRERIRLRTIGEPRPLAQYNQCVLLSSIRSVEWLNELRLTNSSIFTLNGRSESRSVETQSPEPSDWVSVSPSDMTFLATRSSHGAFISRQLREASKFVFIHSAFWRSAKLKLLRSDIVAAARRGVDVVLLHGLANGDDEAAAVDVVRKLVADTRESPGRFYAQESPTRSHAKVLVVDGVRAVVGSYNWLSADADSTRQELSVCVEGTPLVDRVADWSADLLRIGGAAWPAHRLRTSLAGHSDEPDPLTDVRIRLVPDRQNRQRLFAYLREARESVAVGSDQVTPLEDPMLSSLLAGALDRLGPTAVSLRYGRIGGDGTTAILPVGPVDSVQVKGHHAKFAFVDDRRALVTSFNLLSFGGASSGRASGFELGVEIESEVKQPFLSELRRALLAAGV